MGSNVAKLEKTNHMVLFERSAFAAGEYRNAYRGKCGDESIVVKAYKTKFSIDAELECDLEMHQLAHKLAETFSKKPCVGTRTIEGLVPQEATIVESVACSGLRQGERVTVEPFLPGCYEKFVSNNGTFAPENGILTAFCHWTYHYSKGEFMLVDIQGVKTAEKYILTDPAFHSRDNRFGELDLGVVGMQAFFKLHTCNDACRSYSRPSMLKFDWKDCENIMKKRISQAKVAPAAGSAYRYQ